MKYQSLNGSWQFRQMGGIDWSPAQVPGGVHTDLLALGLIPDPFVADNELAVQWVAESDWEYQKLFFVEPGLLEEEHIYLDCEGLDTLADVYLNEHHLGHTENMFRHWEWSVKQFLHSGDNVLRVAFGSPVRFIRDRHAQLPLIGGGDIPGGPHLRKAPCHWGWDWGPKLPPIGIWKDVRLEGHSEARFSNVHLCQERSGHQEFVTVDVKAQAWRDEEFQAILKVISPSGEVSRTEETLMWVDENETHFGTLKVLVPNAQLWWPNGYGAQPLYQVEVWLQDGDTILDLREYTLGFRTLELRQDPDTWGKSFTF